MDAHTLDQWFERAVDTIDRGDLPTLDRLLEEHPELVSRRLDAPGAWLRERVGGALDGFFKAPYLLWFVAEDPVRQNRLPANIVEVAGRIIEAARRHARESLPDQLDQALRLVAWSGVAARCGMQLALIDLLVEAGASPAANANNALVNRHVAAAERLIQLGGRLTLAAALCLDRWDEVPRLFAEANPGQRQFALVLAALNGTAAAVRWMLAAGVSPNQPSADLFSHGTPLHHAVCSGSLDTVQAFVEGGADQTIADTAWNGTPLGWADHYVSSVEPERRSRYEEIARYLDSKRP
ncbi:MAG TPA: ankyrin repeat domain-containing protein [Vicinamibacterales bacterium]|jgi:peptide-methionine (S)-S-oxide reductase